MFTVESTLSSLCFCSDPPLSRQGAALAYLDSIPLYDLVLWTDGSVPFPFGKGGSGLLANYSLCGAEATFSFLAGPVFSGFSAEACAILQVLAGLGSTNKPATSLLSSFCLTLALSSPPSFISISLTDLAGTVFSLLLFYQATMGPRTLIFLGE